MIIIFLDVDPKAVYSKEIYDNAKVNGGEGGIKNSSIFSHQLSNNDLISNYFLELNLFSKIMDVINPGMFIY